MEGKTMERFLACWDAGRTCHVSQAHAVKRAGPAIVVQPAQVIYVGGVEVARTEEVRRSALSFV